MIILTIQTSTVKERKFQHILVTGLEKIPKKIKKSQNLTKEQQKKNKK